MVDVRDATDSLARLDQARERFEAGGPVPIATRDLLVALAAALAESGPLELGVAPNRWLRAQASLGQFVDSMENQAGFGNPEQAVRAIRELRRLFSYSARSARWRSLAGRSKLATYSLFVAPSVVLVGAAISVRVLAGSSGVAAAMILGAIWWFFGSRTERKEAVDAAVARRVASEVAPRERWLCSGMMRHGQVVIATDRRVFAAATGRRRGRPGPLWSLEYAEINSLTGGTLRGRSGAHELRWKELWTDGDEGYQSARATALERILERRAHAAPRPTVHTRRIT